MEKNAESIYNISLLNGQEIFELLWENFQLVRLFSKEDLDKISSENISILTRKNHLFSDFFDTSKLRDYPVKE